MANAAVRQRRSAAQCTRARASARLNVLGEGLGGEALACVGEGSEALQKGEGRLVALRARRRRALRAALHRLQRARQVVGLRAQREQRARLHRAQRLAAVFGRVSHAALHLARRRAHLLRARLHARQLRSREACAGRGA